MSFYNMMFGENDKADILLASLDLNRDNIPRYRDCYLTKDSIVIHTRTGGGNRDYYSDMETCKENYPEYFEGDTLPSGPWNSDLQAHPCYVSDSDDDFDSTYADFVFSFPDKYKADLEALASNNTDIKPSDKWQILIGNLKKPK